MRIMLYYLRKELILFDLGILPHFEPKNQARKIDTIYKEF